MVMSTPTPMPKGIPTPKERRRSRKKPPVGCSMCRRRRIRCDKGIPKCRNCLSQACECEYASPPKVGAAGTKPKVKKSIPGERIVPVITIAMTAASSNGYNIKKKTPPLMTPVAARTSTEVVPLSASTSSSTDSGSPDRVFGQPNPPPSMYRLPPNQHKLLYHMSSIAMSIEACGQSDVVIYLKRLPTFLTIAVKYEFVMHGLMAWAASHMAFTTGSPSALIVSRQFRLLAMQGLQGAIARFNPANSDAVLAASLLLSWQAADPREWATLNQGTCAVIAALSPWRDDSLFNSYIRDDDHYASAPNVTPTMAPLNFLSPSPPSPNGDDESAALHYIYSALDRVAAYAATRPAEAALIARLMSFVQNVEANLPITHPVMRFYLCEPVRSMLYWYPVQFYDAAQDDPITMVVLAHLYAISLTVQPVFAGPGAAHFRGLSTVPIEEIYVRLVERHERSSGKMNTFVPLSLMHFPMQSVALFRSRIGLSTGPLNVDQSLEGIRMGLDPGAVVGAGDIMAGEAWDEFGG